MNSNFIKKLFFLIFTASLITCKNNQSARNEGSNAETVYSFIPVAKIIYPFTAVLNNPYGIDSKDFLVDQILAENKLTIKEQNRYSDSVLFNEFETHIVCFANNESEIRHCEETIKELHTHFRKMSFFSYYRALTFPMLCGNENTVVKGYVLPRKVYERYAEKVNCGIFLRKLNVNYCFNISKIPSDSLMIKNTILLGLSKNFENNPDLLRIVKLEKGNYSLDSIYKDEAERLKSFEKSLEEIYGGDFKEQLEKGSKVKGVAKSELYNHYSFEINRLSYLESFINLEIKTLWLALNNLGVDYTIAIDNFKQIVDKEKKYSEYIDKLCLDAIHDLEKVFLDYCPYLANTLDSVSILKNEIKIITETHLSQVSIDSFPLSEYYRASDKLLQNVPVSPVFQSKIIDPVIRYYLLLSKTVNELRKSLILLQTSLVNNYQLSEKQDEYNRVSFNVAKTEQLIFEVLNREMQVPKISERKFQKVFFKHWILQLKSNTANGHITHLNKSAELQLVELGILEEVFGVWRSKKETEFLFRWAENYQIEIQFDEANYNKN